MSNNNAFNLKNIFFKTMMKKYITGLLAILLLSCTKQQNQSTQYDTRIISLSPHITEIIYALNVESELVAVTDYCKYPSEAQNKESIGGLLNPNIEKIVSLKPTHMFGVPSHSKLNQEILKFGLKILMLSNETLEDIQSNISIISDTLNVAENGIQLNESIKNGMVKLQENRIEGTPIKAMLVIGREKGSVKNITVAGPNTYLNEIWQKAGGINIFNDLTSKYATVNIEEIIIRNPEAIIEFDFGGEEGIKNVNPGDEWEYLYKVKAIKQKNIFEIGGNYSLIPGPRVLKLAKDFVHIINSVFNEK
jgi:ABC-type Fe3+-hydroxamate transport system substrate-binding protein